MSFLISSISIAQKKAILSRPFTSTLKKGAVHQFLDELNAGSGIVIEYSSTTLDADRIVTLDGSETTVGGLLKKVLQGQHVALLEKNNKLILVKSKTVFNTGTVENVFTVYGIVKAMNSKEPMVGASVFEPATGKGVATNPYGYFNLSLPAGTHHLTVSYVGYQENSFDIVLDENTRRDIELTENLEKIEIPEIIVYNKEALKRNGADKLNADQYKPYNYLFGENDPVRSFYLLPGVKNIPSSFNGMYVRGGGPDENLFLLDGIRVNNPSHMLGALSIVNESSMKTMQLYKSDFPSKYGGAISSVIDIFTKDGNMEQWQGEANVGILSGSFTLEGPVIKNKTAVMASFRRSWPLKIFQKGIEPDFYDLHFKLTQIVDKNGKLMINFYTGHDRVNQVSDNIDNLHKWGNLIGSISWNKLLGGRSFINTSVNMSSYHNLGAFQYTLVENDAEDQEVEIESGSVGSFSSTEQYNAKTQAEIFLNNKARLNLGAKFTHTIIKPFETKISGEIDDDEESFTAFTPLPFNEYAVYSETELKIGSKFFIRPGLHFDAYQFKTYHANSFQPRFFASYSINNQQQLFASYNQMTQFLHLVTNPYLEMNADIWVPSTKKLLPEQSSSYNLGYAYNNLKGFKLSVEGYYKELKDVTNYAEGKSYLVNSETWEQNITTGKGWAYGAELFFQKTSGKLNFLGSYTLAWSWRQFDGINNGEKFPYKFDRRHSVSAGVNYEFIKNLEATVLWTFSTGDVFSVPDYIYPDFDNAQQINNPDDLLNDFRFIYHSDQSNRYRTSPYHRLDANLKFHAGKNKSTQWIITAGVYNIYGSADQYVYDLKGTIGGTTTLIESSLKTFDITPYLSVTFKF